MDVQIGQCAWIHHHTQRDAKSLELVTPSRQRSKPRETANKDRDQRIQNTGATTRRAFKAEEPNGPPKAEDLWGFHGDSMAMTKQFPLQSMIHLNEPIVKQKEEKELMSETRREEECLRNIRNQIETKQTDFIKHSTTSQAQTSRSYYTQHNDEGTNHVDTLWISSSFQSTVNQRKRQRYNV
eukprot:465340_1